MMWDVDALNRGSYHKFTHNYTVMSHILHQHDCSDIPGAYCTNTLEPLLAKGMYILKNSKKEPLIIGNNIEITTMLANIVG